MNDRPRLHLDRVTAPDTPPERWLVVLHGIYGAGRNWGSVARRFVRERPAWGALLVDLRQHGASRGFSPPHTVAAAADDVVEAIRASDVETHAILGHSFGGKVALVATRVGIPGLRQAWVVDSTPGTREPEGSAWDMLAILRRNPGPFDARDGAVDALRGEGLPLPLARWMATNVEEEGGVYRWRIDADDMEALLRSFFAEDAWDVLEAPPEGVSVHVVKAEDSSVLDEAACERVEQAGRREGRVHLHRVSGGHWVNADNPDALHALLLEHLA
ncbi:MAG: alpha/beta hydrolase [Gemmatimonadetes bacterium]|nr:alpha/beta hydrolase [Gemmatimonadota bacterium]